MAALLTELGIRVWSVFFLVPTGRGQARDMIAPAEHERVFNWLYDLSKQVPFHIRTTAAQHYRRVVVQRKRVELGQPADGAAGGVQWEMTGAGYSFKEGRAPAQRGVNDGNGFCFVSHTGEVYPSGFLQVSGGNVRERGLSEIYRQSPVFQALRDPDRLKGKCGICTYRSVCGGSRARAYGVTGDYLETDPSCVHEPAGEHS